MPNTRHNSTFDVEAPASTVSAAQHPDKAALRRQVRELVAQGLSYRAIGRSLGIHWTRVGQIVRGKNKTAGQS